MTNPMVPPTPPVPLETHDLTPSPQARHDMDERVNFHGHDPDDVMRRLMGVEETPRRIEAHEEGDDPGREKDETPYDS